MKREPTKLDNLKAKVKALEDKQSRKTERENIKKQIGELKKKLKA